MAEKKNTEFDRPGGYAMPKGATQVQSRVAAKMKAAGEAGEIKLFGDRGTAHEPLSRKRLHMAHHATYRDTNFYC